MSTLAMPQAAPNSATSMNIRIYNTLSGKKEPFEPLVPGKVGIYLCGPTVYKPAHVGHMVGPVIFDTIARYLTYCGFEVTWVVNITDVDDKLIHQSQKRGLPMSQIAEEMTQDYLDNLAAFGVDQITHMPRATTSMRDIIKLIEQLVEKDFAYEADGDVFFDVLKDPQYGKLSNRSADSQQGEGGSAAAKKRSPSDFALWKSAKPDEPSWDSPWGKGRPGWHIECSAMSRSLLGESFDIHGGGLDLIFPHHENEIAQSECCHSKPMAKYWVHNGLLRSDASAGKLGGRGDRADSAGESQEGGKMSRSKGAGGLAELAEKHGGATLRFFLLRTHYRSTVVFGDEHLAEAKTSLTAFLRFFERCERITGESYYDIAPIVRRAEGEIDAGGDELLEAVSQRRTSFLSKMDDDFNTGAALADLFELVRTLNKAADDRNLEDTSARTDADLQAWKRGVAALRELSSILGLFLEAPKPTGGEDDGLAGKLMELLIELRATARQEKQYAIADRIRDGLKDLNITIEDRKEGTTWRRDE